MDPTPIRDIVLDAYTKATSKSIRNEQLNIMPHFVPLFLDALNVSLGSVIVQDLEQMFPDPEMLEQAKAQPEGTFADSIISMKALGDRIEAYVKQRHANKLYITSTGYYLNSPGTVISLDDIMATKLPAVVFLNNKLVGVLYSSYDSAYNGLFRDFLNKEIYKFINDNIYTGPNSKYKRGFDVGHILGNSELAKTPLGIKIQTALDALSRISDIDIDIPGYVPKHKSQVESLKTKIETEFQKLHDKSSIGKSIEVMLEKDFSPVKAFLLSVKANVVIIQDRVENQYLYGTLIESLVESEVKKILVNSNFSNSLVQEFALRYGEVLKGKTSFKKENARKKIPKADISAKKKKISVSKKTTKVKSGVKKPTVINKVLSIVPKLQALLDRSLVDRIKRNMGDGSRKDILNLRSGRFAESVKVERMSQSREGMITAFYTYMKNPYATFSTGGDQQFPRTRDPKLLISKSIREIATQQVANRLRAVSI